MVGAALTAHSVRVEHGVDARGVGSPTRAGVGGGQGAVGSGRGTLDLGGGFARLCAKLQRNQRDTTNEQSQ